jgi:hypothetical protein
MELHADDAAMLIVKALWEKVREAYIPADHE